MNALLQLESLEEKLVLVRKLRDVKCRLRSKIDKISKVKQTLLQKEVEARRVMAEYLRDDCELLSLKDDVEETMPLSEVASNQVETRKKKAMMDSTSFVGVLGGLDAELKDTQRALESTSKLNSALKEAASRAQMDLASAVKTRSDKHRQLTDFARAHFSSPAQELPSEVLCMIFSVLPTEDLVTVGQVCQRWRGVTRSERADLLWTNRRLVLEYPSQVGLLRILFAAPTLGHVMFNRSVRSQVRDTRCKIHGMEIMNSDRFGYSGLFKKHAEHLTSLTLQFFDSNIATAVSNLPQLKDLTLLVRQHYYGSLIFPSDMKCSLERLRLDVTFYDFTSKLSSFLIPHTATLKCLTLGHTYCMPTSREGKENLVSMLGQCKSLEELQLPVCHDTSLDFSCTPIKLKCLRLLFTNACKHFVSGVQNVNMSPEFLFAPNSVLDLNIVLEHSGVYAMVTRFLKSLKPSFRASLKLVCFTSLSTVSSESSQMLKSVVQEIPEFCNDKCQFKWLM